MGRARPRRRLVARRRQALSQLLRVNSYKHLLVCVVSQVCHNTHVVCLSVGSSLPKSTSPSSLLHIPEELDLPFPEAGLPSSLQSTPPNSQDPSPFPSLPSTPPQSHTPPKAFVPGKVYSHAELSQRLNGHDASHEPPKPVRSSSIDLSTIGGVAGALSKVKSMKVMKGLFSSLSSHDPGVSHVTSQPQIYRNSDVHQSSSLPTPIVTTPTTVTATPIAGIITTSPPSSVEQGEFASIASPLSDASGDWLSSTSPPPPPGTVSPPPTYTPHPDTLSFSNTTLDTRYTRG